MLAAASAGAEFLLKSDATRVDPGQPFEVQLVLLNDTAAAMPGILPDRLPVRVAAGAREFTAELRLVDQGNAPPTLPPPLAPGAFRKARYTLTLPPDVEGAVVLSLTDVKASPLTLIAQRAQPIGGAAIAEAKPTPAPLPDPERLDRRPEPALQTYEPMYFVIGRRAGETTAKYQLSFKYRLFDERGMISAFLKPLAKLHFGYTQTSLWNLSQESKPFKDTSYKPGFFYFEPAAWTSADGRYNIGLAGGFEHESNGQSGALSRSMNTLFVRPQWRALITDRYYLYIAPKVWHYLEKGENPDIQRYRGYFDLNVRVGRADGLQLSTNYRKGTSTMGAVQVELSYPIRQPFFADAGGFLMFQYFNGYGDGLLDYNVKGPAQFRFGFAIVR